MAFIQSIRVDAVQRHRWSVAALIAANLVPLVGVLAFGWSTLNVVLLYWMENVVIGVINVLKMVTCWPGPGAMINAPAAKLVDQHEDENTQSAGDSGGGTDMALQASKLFLVPFFTVHYGGFCLGHGMFICIVLGGSFSSSMLGNPLDIGLQAFQSTGMKLGVLALAVSHFVSYCVNFLGRGEYRRTSPPALMFRPYARIVVLHVAIVFSGFFILVLDSPNWLLVLLVVGKTLLDLAVHLMEHTSAEEESP